MESIKCLYKNIITIVLIVFSLIFVSCKNEDNPVVLDYSASKIAGRISSSGNMPKQMSKTGSASGAIVTLAQIQSDGSLKTVSLQSVEADASGKFIVETNLSRVKNLIVIAQQGAMQWKAIVSAEVNNGTTVYSPPLNDESSTEADIYIKAASEGKLNGIFESDLKTFLNAQISYTLHSNVNAQAQFITSLQARFLAMNNASSNSYFGLSNSQLAAIVNAQADACAKLDEDLYMSDDSENENEIILNNFDNSTLAVCSKNNINLAAYTELVRIGISAFTSSSASFNADTKFAMTKYLYTRFAFILNSAMYQQFQTCGATQSQLTTVSNAGASLYIAIKNSTDMSQVSNAFVQYHSSIKSQLQLALNSYASALESLDVSINSAGNVKTILNAALNTSTAFNTIVNAYITFYSTVSSSVQAALAGAAASQLNAASQILILSNMN